uniref:FHA domain-containing protein n=1 Tax=Onchocerca volvulus TaxID=6282 RepID=A0A8R1XQA1_ONCVO
MVVTISYRDKPDEILYSFSKVGDSICIGRDKRQCRIALGVNAQGVSRVHLKLELLSNGCLFSRDTSTYGTGYDGGSFVIERVKELKPPVVLQIGSFFFIIKDTNVKEESITDPFLRIAEINSRKRVASKEATVIIEEECVTEKRKIVDKSEMEKLTPGAKDLGREIAKSTEIKGKIAAQSNSGLNTNEAWIQEQIMFLKDRKLVAKLGKKVKEKLDSVKLDYYRRIADFLPSDDEEDEESGEKRSKVSVFAAADSSRNISSITEVPLQYYSSKTSTCDMVQDTYFPDMDTSISSKQMQHKNTSKEAEGLFKGLTSMKIMPKSPANDFILAGAKEDGILDDIDAEKLFKPLLSSTQLTSFQEKPKKSVNEESIIEKNNTSVFHAEQFSDLLESQSLSEKFCNLPFKTMPKKKNPVPPKIINGQNTIAEFTSCIDTNTAKKRSNQFGNQSNADEVVVISKRVKMEVVEDEDERQVNVPEKNDSLIENRTECEVNVDENDRTLEMNIETLREKLRKAVQYENLERPILTKDRSQSHLTGHWQEFNCKRFRKAAQGSHNGCGLLHSTMSRIVGVADLIDFREIS